MKEKNSESVNSTSELNMKIAQLQYEKFGAINEFHTSRTAKFLSELVKSFGEEVLEDAKKIEVDYKDLIRWHLKRTNDLLVQLQKKYGQEVMDIIIKMEKEERARCGKELSQNCSGNLIDDIIPYFGGEQNVVEKSKDSCVLHTKYCALANAAKDACIDEFVYKLHCCNDPSFVEGFNSNLECEVRKCLLTGDEYCEHHIYIKETED